MSARAHQGELGMERSTVVKDELTEQNVRFFSIYVETKNSCFVMLNEREDKLGTLAIAVPVPKELFGSPFSSILVGDRNTASARILAERTATAKGKIALVSIYLESIDEKQGNSVFNRLIERATHADIQGEGVTCRV